MLVEAVGLRKEFGDFAAVDGIDVQVRRGEAFGFLGPNGAGKSSTMRMIGCVSPPTGGTLRILGRDPRREGAQIRARLGVVPQQDSLDGEPDRPRQPADLRALLRPVPCRVPSARRRACWSSRTSSTAPTASSSRCRAA
ncbi:hypothetical protein GCM10025868_07270 [Angustibacter aerolatus]|uniref:ABC transporter domain-containing protein n=1 Tax=Angustibacter aerolatus TaxID=1162965 RepID=A0ABQ6JCH7_9ACTN|nr:hypothetical protein GCM10025868_07270 [Angustibacter aerolatus]